MTFSGRQDFLIITKTIQRLFERDSCFFIGEGMRDGIEREKQRE